MEITLAVLIMKKVLVFNSIFSDGVGDFTHFEDIMKVLLTNPQFKNVEFIPIVKFVDGGKEANYKRIHEKLKMLGIPFLYGKTHEHEEFSKNQDVQQLVGDADQALSISSDQNSVTAHYANFFKKNMPIKYVGEHEKGGNIPHYSDTLTLERNLGLGKDCYGIKITEVPHLSRSEAWSIIENNDPVFASELLACTHTDNFQKFSEQNTLIPAYYNKYEGLHSLLHHLTVNDFEEKKDIAIYLSGMDVKARFFDDDMEETLESELSHGKFRSIEVIRAGNSDPVTINCNPNATRILRILPKHFVTDESYKALYQLADMVAVSGDNTFELAVSNKVFPLYTSTNHRNKADTILALHAITQLEELPISPKARAAYDEFYKVSNICPVYPYHVGKPVNFDEMIKAWPIIADYLQKNKNFYDKLNDIVLESMPRQDLYLDDTEVDEALTKVSDKTSEEIIAPANKSFKQRFSSLISDEKSNDDEASLSTKQNKGPC